MKNNLKSKCPCCINQIVVNGINDIPTIAPWMIKYFPKGYEEAKLYTPGSGEKVHFKCPFCNRIKSNKISIYSLYYKKTISCVCSDGISYPEKFVYNLLEQLNLEFIFQYTPEWGNHKRYDFYFIYNNEKYIIETDGEQHFKDSMFSSYENIHKNDTTKDKMAVLNNVNLIRIDCSISNVEYIKNNIIHTELNNLFDLKNINWEQCELFATSNFIKNVCDFTSQNMNLSFNKIANHFKIAPSTVRKYIKFGDRLGWIDYENKLNSTEIDNSNLIKTLGIKRQYVENSKGLYSMKQSLKKIIEEDNKRRSEEIFYKFLY